MDDVRRPSICAAESSEEVEIVAPCEVIDSPFGVERAGGGDKGTGLQVRNSTQPVTDGWMGPLPGCQTASDSPNEPVPIILFLFSNIPPSFCRFQFRVSFRWISFDYI